MQPHGLVKALQQENVERFVGERRREAARRRPKSQPGALGELLNALALGLASIGIPGNGGRGHPARPAY